MMLSDLINTLGFLIGELEARSILESSVLCGDLTPFRSLLLLARGHSLEKVAASRVNGALEAKRKRRCAFCRRV
jgi:hypothetical protein